MAIPVPGLMNGQITPEGGFAILCIAGEALARGELVEVGAANGNVKKTEIDCDVPVGLVYADAAAGAYVWVVVAGIAHVLPNAADTAARGYIIYSSSTTKGRVSQSATVPTVANHNREVGHFLDNGTGAGAIARAIIHWN